MVQNILGNGIDIPLLGLREASREVEGEYHELFNDESYKIAQCFMLSTSQVTSLQTSVQNCTMIRIALNVKLHKKLHNKNLFKHNLLNFFNAQVFSFVIKKFLFRWDQETKQGVFLHYTFLYFDDMKYLQHFSLPNRSQNVGRLFNKQFYGLWPSYTTRLWMLLQPPPGRNNLLRLGILFG